MSSDEKTENPLVQSLNEEERKKSERRHVTNIRLAILSLSLGILSLVLYLKDQKVRRISYHISNPVFKIYDKKNATSVIKLVLNDSIPVMDNVYLLTGGIWNDGDLPINKEDLRDSISIKLENCKQILDYKVVSQNDPNVAKFTLTPKSNAELSVNWKYFDPEYGFSFQIMYVGKADVGFNLKGKVLGIDNFTEYVESKEWR